MPNFRLVATLLLLGAVIFPIATRWSTQPDGSWFRPFIVWAMLVFAAYLIHRHRVRDES
ncbi:MAG: hypothetical protein ACPG3V_05785 [Porticoccaceae bacterium]|jgi:uncharacterized membrane protein YfcA